MSGVHASAQNARVEVIMRLRPPPKGKEDNMVIRKQPDQPTIMNICDSLNPNAVEREFAFDNICHTEASQNEVFEIVSFYVFHSDCLFIANTSFPLPAAIISLYNDKLIPLLFFLHCSLRSRLSRIHFFSHCLLCFSP